MLLGLVGVSGVGKTYFKEKIVQELGFQAVNTIRTREKRIGEENGKTGLFKTESATFTDACAINNNGFISEDSFYIRK